MLKRDSSTLQGDKTSKTSSAPGPSRSGTRRRRYVPAYEFMAASVGDAGWLNQSLLSLRGADEETSPITFDKDGMAPIHLAASNCHLDCLRLLVEQHNVDVNLRSKTGWCPIHLCIRQRHGKRASDCVDYLLSAGANPSLANDEGVTPLHRAASEGHLECLQALIKSGALVDGLDHNGHTPYDLARVYSHKECARLISSATWCQEKRMAALDARRIEIERMCQVLDELALYEELSEERDFFGEQAFNAWLQKRNLGKPPVQPPTSRDKKPSRESCDGFGSGTERKKEEHLHLPRRKAGHVGKSAGNLSDGMLGESSASAAALCKPESDPSVQDVEESSVPRASTATVRWNTSTKAPSVRYAPRLRDHAERDPFTRLPARRPVRHSLSPAMKLAIEHRIKTGNVNIARTQAKKAKKKENSKVDNGKLGYQKLKELTADLLLESMDGPAIVFKPRTVLDVEKLRAPSSVRRDEAAFHLVPDDPTSWLFRNALLPTAAVQSCGKMVPDTPQSTTSLQSACSQKSM